MITTRGLTKRYGRVTAVESVDLDVPAGVRYGLLGPNGSGKTTMIRMLLGLVYATSGTITMFDRPVPARVREVLPGVGALIEGPAFYGHLSGRVNLSLLDASGPSPAGSTGAAALPVARPTALPEGAAPGAAPSGGGPPGARW